jgi:hypothetical protein
MLTSHEREIGCEFVFQEERFRLRQSTETNGQTRRRFGGRQPLCGMGVTSRIAVT